MGQDRRERRRVALDLGEALVRRGLLVDPRDRIEVRIAEERTTELVDQRVLELGLGKTAGSRARGRRRSWGSRGRRDRTARNGRAYRNDRADRDDRATRDDRAAADRDRARRG